MPNKHPHLKHKIAQKLMLDLRFYHSEITHKLEPVTELPDDIAHLITNTALGGVILFSENLKTAEQIIKLNRDLQYAALKSELRSPLLISIDQEGGRVTRLPLSASTAFTGNMSIGATYKKYGTYYAKAVANVLAEDLAALGINVNNAPCVDVNNNPDNPVINIRAFSEDPQVVAQLGAAQINAMQTQNILCAIKHFPGHGDTQVDSHTGLPQVNKSLSAITQNELLPFSYAFEQASPAMLMTAHIQYPALDNSLIVTKDGDEIIKPATMSYKIMHELLREEMKYEGVSITDALDMAGISDYFTVEQAVINTFKADVDIALMPIKIRCKADLKKLSNLIAAIEHSINNDELKLQQIENSFKRIQRIKKQFKLAENIETAFEQKARNNNKERQIENKKLEQELALQSITLVKGEIEKTLGCLSTEQIHIVMPDSQKAQLLAQALQDETPHTTLTIETSSLIDSNIDELIQKTRNAEQLIIGHISPKQSAVEWGGIDDLARIKALDKISATSPERLLKLLKVAKEANLNIIFVSLRAPYEISHLSHYADIVLATYAYNVKVENDFVHAPSYQALAKIITGKSPAQGDLPVSIDNN